MLVELVLDLTMLGVQGEHCVLVQAMGRSEAGDDSIKESEAGEGLAAHEGDKILLEEIGREFVVEMK